MSKARFFYLYDLTGEHRRPVVTICRLRNDKGRYGYGWAICSDADNPCKRTGRAIAEGRARAALLHKDYKKPFQEGEAFAWLYAPGVSRLSALNVLMRCGVFPLNSRNICFGMQDLFAVLPKAMLPLAEANGGQHNAHPA
mgnify:CR=1 FL=1